MGSGSNGPYGGGSTGSQPYAPSYHVVPDMLTTDKKDSDIYKSNSGYFKNPTATNLENAIDGNRVVFNGKSVEGQFTYVMDTNGNIIFGKRYNPNNSSKRSPHPTLIGGKIQKCNVPELLSLQKAGFLVLMIAAVTLDLTQNHLRRLIASLINFINAIQICLTSVLNGGNEYEK